MVSWQVVIWAIVISYFIGGFFGVFIMAALQLGKQSDEQMEKWYKENTYESEAK